jgi:hypothetical protein
MREDGYFCKIFSNEWVAEGVASDPHNFSPRFGTAQFRITYLMPTLMMRPRGCKKNGLPKRNVNFEFSQFWSCKAKKGFSNFNSEFLIPNQNHYFIFLVGLKMLFMQMNNSKKKCNICKGQIISEPNCGVLDFPKKQ